MTLIASSFLAGSILSLLLPVLLLIALVVWYLRFISRVPETGEGEDAAAAANPGRADAPASAGNPRPAGGPGGAASPGTSPTPREG